MRDDGERVRDMLEAIERIERHAGRGRDAFAADELLQTWMLHHLRIIGEAARALTPAFRQRHSAIPWSKIIGMRTILVHHYFDIDLPIVWSVIEKDVTSLKRELTALLRSGELGQLP